MRRFSLDRQIRKHPPPFRHMGDAAAHDLFGREAVDAGAVEMLISPRVSGSSPEMARRVVVLPAPFAPMMVTMPPAGTAIETPLSAAIFW